MKVKIEELKKNTKNISLLYVEDNETLVEHVKELMSRFFEKDVYFASNGAEGLKLFREHEPNIVITDINMPEMNGLEMVTKIKKVDPFVKCVFLSAHDEIDLLHKAMRIGAIDYLVKPAKATELINTLMNAINMIHEEKNYELMNSQLHNIVDYQKNIIIMIENDEVTFINKQFLLFFDVEDFEEYTKSYGSLNELLQPHEGFLYSHDDIDWIKHVKENTDKIFHAKTFDSNKAPIHFLVRCNTVPERDNLSIITLNDITDLNLLKLFDSNQTLLDNAEHTNASIISLFKLIKDNSSKLKVYNFYKGVPIIKECVISNLDNNECTIKVDFSTIKIINIHRYFVLSSEVFPTSIMCADITNIDYDNLSITFKKFIFEKTDISNRNDMRVVPDPGDKITIIHKGVKFLVDIKIVDISVKSVRVAVKMIPELNVNDDVQLTFALKIGKVPLSLTVQAKIHLIESKLNGYELVFIFKMNHTNESKLFDYISKRQITLIKEFKDRDI